MSLRAPLNDDLENGSTNSNHYGMMMDSSTVDYDSASNKQSFRQLPSRWKFGFGFLSFVILILTISLIYLIADPLKKDVDEPAKYIYINQTVYLNETVYIDDSASSQSLMDLGREMDQSRNLSVDPCDDYYQYSCGGWISSIDLNLTNSQMVTKGFTYSQAVNDQYVQDIIDEDWPVVSPFYDSCTDVETINRLGYAPIKPLMDYLNPVRGGVRTVDDAFLALGELRLAYGGLFFFQSVVTSNQSNPRQAILSMRAGGTTVSDWRFYVNNRTQLEAGVSEMFQEIGDNAEDAMRFAKLAIGFEAKLINITQRGRINQENADGTMRALTVEERLREEKEQLAARIDVTIATLIQMAPHIPWVTFFDGTMIPKTLNTTMDNVPIAYQDDGELPLLDALIGNSSVSEIVAYARWRALNSTSFYMKPVLNEIRTKHFNAFTPHVTDPFGATNARKVYCKNMVVRSVQDLMGRYFVERRLPTAARNVARNLISWIRDAFEDNLPSVSWMDDATRALALEKARAVAELVGGPENGNWSDYSQVWLKRDTFYDNFYQINSLDVIANWKLLGGPISRYHFGMSSVLVNAQYSRTANAMLFPAGILTEPFFSFDYPMSVNLGRIGMVMGHELMHGFDAGGSEYDKDGIRRVWWDPLVRQQFITRTQCMIKQYDAVQVQGFNVSGSLTLNENIADNSGLKLAYAAFVKYQQGLASMNRTDPVPNKSHTKAPLTSNQLFFWAHAQTWCTKATDAAIRSQIRGDAHAPGEARVWVPLTNHAGFADAFKCPVGSKMNPGPRCDIY